ncbi:hypothetical protein PA13076_2 [Salmonella phage vB_SenM_PA13076]|nr:hypothetical protein PA13076_2 [Salmonella phage vB_SenM_PA13076]
MATIIDSFLVTLESKADSSGFDLFDQLSRRFVITLGDVINLAERAAGALGRMFAPALEADVLAAKIKGFGYDVESTWKTLMDMSLQMGTPFQEALDGFTKLKSYGVDPLNGSLQMLKTITAATGGDLARTIVAYGQASAMGSLQGQEKNQFINAGVDIWGALSRYTGKKLGELQDMMRQKQITADILTSALKQEAERLKPIAHEVSQTLKAQLTNLSTIWYAARSKIAQTRVWDEVTKGAISMVKSLTAVLNDTTLTAAFKKFDEVVFNTIENVKRLIYVIGDNFPLMVAITSYALLSLIPVLAALIPWLAKVGNAFVGLATKMLMNPLTWIVLAIGTVVAVLTDLDDALAGRETVVKWSKDVVAAWGIVKQYIVVIADFILSIFDGRLWNKLGNWWQGFLVEVKQGIEQIKLWLSEALYQLPGGKFLMALFGKLDSTLGFAGNKLVAGAEATANAVSPTTEQGGSFWSRALNWSMRNFNPITGEMTAGGQAMQSAINTAKQNQQQNATVIHQDNSVKVDATITGVQNPQEVGREVNDQVKQAQKENATVRANNKNGGNTMSDIFAGITDAANNLYQDARDRLMGDGTTTLRFRNCGGIKMDAVTNEEHQSDLDIADNELESGAKASDHAAVQPKVITVTGVVVGYIDESIQESTVSDVTGLRSMDFLDDIQLPQVVSTVLEGTRDFAVNKLVSFIDWGGLDATISRSLVPWLPDFSIAEQLKSSDNMRIEQVYRTLLDLQKNVIYCDVDTGIFKYTNMLLKSVRVVQEKDGSATFTLTFREVIEVPIVVTNAVAAKSTGRPANNGTKKSGRAQGQGDATSKKDINTTTPISEKRVNDNRGFGVTLGDMFGFNLRGIF